MFNRRFIEGVYDSSKNIKYNEEYYFEAIKKKFLTLNFIQENKDSQIKNFHFLKYGNLILRVHNCVIASSVLVEASLLKFLEALGLFRL